MRANWKIVVGSGAILIGLILAVTLSHFSSVLDPVLHKSWPMAAVASSHPAPSLPTKPLSTATTSAIVGAAVTSSKTTVTAKTSTASVAAAVTTQPPAALSIAGSHLLSSLVNIVCISIDPRIPSISGSGVVIDKRGIILTAAHVAQLFLLADYLGPSKVQCLVRTGSPARRAYTAEPIYISSSWLNANPSTLTTKSPVGTGQYDVALLAVTGTANSNPVPSSLSFTPLSSDDPGASEPVSIATYGAQYLSSTDINYSLYPILVFGSIFNRYTFETNTVDEFSVKGTSASQEGSSGGGIVDSSGHLLGIITTSIVTGAVQDRTLNAVTTGHLRRTFAQDMGENLDSTLANSSLNQLVNNFSSEASSMGAQLAKTVGN